MILVSGSYMSRSDRLPELSLWLLLGQRPETRSQRWKAPLSKSDALRQIAVHARALSSFAVVRVVTGKESVERPFSVAEALTAREAFVTAASMIVQPVVHIDVP